MRSRNLLFCVLLILIISELGSIEAKKDSKKSLKDTCKAGDKVIGCRCSNPDKLLGEVKEKITKTKTRQELALKHYTEALESYLKAKYKRELYLRSTLVCVAKSSKLHSLSKKEKQKISAAKKWFNKCHKLLLKYTKKQSRLVKCRAQPKYLKGQLARWTKTYAVLKRRYAFVKRFKESSCAKEQRMNASRRSALRLKMTRSKRKLSHFAKRCPKLLHRLAKLHNLHKRRCNDMLLNRLGAVVEARRKKLTEYDTKMDYYNKCIRIGNAEAKKQMNVDIFSLRAELIRWLHQYKHLSVHLARLEFRECIITNAKLKPRERKAKCRPIWLRVTRPKFKHLAELQKKTSHKVRTEVTAQSKKG